MEMDSFIIKQETFCYYIYQEILSPSSVPRHQVFFVLFEVLFHETEVNSEVQESGSVK